MHLPPHSIIIVVDIVRAVFNGVALVMKYIIVCIE